MDRAIRQNVAAQIKEHIPALKRYALVLARNASAADDLVQDCLVRALTKADLYKDGTNLRAWLFTIMHNLHVNEKRREGRWKQPADPGAALASLSEPAAQTESVMLRAVRKAMFVLPWQQRSILYSVGVEGKTYEEVSDEFDIPIGTVKSRCSRARAALQDALERRTVAAHA